MCVFYLSAICCMSCSTIFHTCYTHSEQLSFFFTKYLTAPCLSWSTVVIAIVCLCFRLDYTGIVSLIVGSTYPCIFFIFYCNMYVHTVCRPTHTLTHSSNLLRSPQTHSAWIHGADNPLWCGLPSCHMRVRISPLLHLLTLTHKHINLSYC